ncbi:MAG: PD-(D/E)XK nuclease family protein [Candidatus Eremiobacteraeota bacterium]|nr:PD-(D/E)XK nuclease family protein [Candidatus Eremiobacteraeota bacterium]
MTDAALVFAGADADEPTAALARALLSVRQYYPLGPKPLDCELSGGGQVRHVPSLRAALVGGVVAAPRALLDALGVDDLLGRATRGRRRPLGRKRVTLASILSGASVDGSPAEAQPSVLCAAAAAADGVWSKMSDPPPIERRLGLLGDALARRFLADGDCTIVADAAGEPVDLTLVFADEPAHGWPRWAAFAAAVGVDPRALQAAVTPSGQVAVVMQPLGQAVAQFVTEQTRYTATWMAPSAEAPRPLQAPAMTFSASRLNAFSKCPRRWFFEYLCDAVEDPGSAAATYGKVFHEALEALHKEMRFPAKDDAATLVCRLTAELDAAFGKRRFEFASKLEYEVSRLKARLVARHYVRWLVAEASARPFEIVETELMQRWSSGGHSFVGYVDRIDRPIGGGPLTIFDYKTGRIDEDPDEYLDKVRSGEEAQLALYYAMLRASNETVGRMALVSIRDPRDSVWILALDVGGEDGAPLVSAACQGGVARAHCSAADLEVSLSKLLERCDILTGPGLDHFPAGVRPPCSYCAYAKACRERPADEERIFAR